MATKYTQQALEEAIRESVSMAEAMRKLGIQKWSGGLQNWITFKAKKYGIDTSHFKKQATNSGPNHKGGPAKLTYQEILVMQPPGFFKTKTYKLRRALIESGVPYVCSNVSCRVGALWNLEPLTLEVDHINGNPTDHRPENLRFLCPNCHSQTATYSNKKRS